MSATGIRGLDHSIDSTNRWIGRVAAAFGTEDRDFAYRALRAWMHTVRDRLPVESAAHLAAQLPELLRGVFYEGWNPAHVPYKYDASDFTRRLAEEARIHRDDVPKTAALVTDAVASLMASGGIDQALRQLPADLRRLLRPGGPAEAGTGTEDPGAW